MLLAVFIAGAMVSCVVETRRVVPRSNAEAMKRPSTVLGEYSTENLNLSSRLYNEARYLSESDTLVTNLPGLTTEDASKIKQHAGYLHLSGNVGAIFYWMFENPDPDAPLILWFNGGPVSC
jgi:carboxypeptidase C (cathepsin A)